MIMISNSQLNPVADVNLNQTSGWNHLKKKVKPWKIQNCRGWKSYCYTCQLKYFFLLEENESGGKGKNTPTTTGE